MSRHAIPVPPCPMNEVTTAAQAKRWVDENRKRNALSSAPGGVSRGARNGILGDYTLGKTLGSGSMSKVKLAQHIITGEKFAIKIVPRTSTSYLSDVDDDSLPLPVRQIRRKEVRTVREAGLGLLLPHPHIRGMREMIVDRHHYYLVFEYVDGRQMLDYIIEHGRLQERKARKFARQIGGALEYAHMNNVVHRDLTIQNILISRTTGDVKIIDFGLANLWNPSSHLSTCCGSFYGAAPEILNGELYTGPAVDVWNFGVVLYILVCGKVPFDDKTMSALHHKIKMGQVAYPTWLSAECKHLLSQMLTATSAARASLLEVLAHPWINRNSSGPPSSHLIQRESLRSLPNARSSARALDRSVIRCISGFGFGTEAEIETKLLEVLQSEDYRCTVEAWETRRDDASGRASMSSSETRVDNKYIGGNDGPLASTTTLVSLDNMSSKASRESPKQVKRRSPSRKSRWSSGFDNLRKKLFSFSASIGRSAVCVNSSPPPNSASSYLADPSRKDLPDPTRAFHPLLSIYFLAREKMERERLSGSERPWNRP